MTKKTTALDILTAAYAIVIDPAKWTQGSRARDKAGNNVCTFDKAAVCFCTVGAIEKVAGPRNSMDRAHADARGYLSRVANAEFYRSPISVNDEIGHDFTLLMFEKAIELAKEEAARV